MALTLRATKGAKLTNTEADANLSGLASGSNMTLPFNIGSGKFQIDASGNITTTGDISFTNAAQNVQGGTAAGYVVYGNANLSSYIQFWGASHASAGIVQLIAGSSERARMTAGGYFKASNSGAYQDSAGAYHELRTDADNVTTYIANTKASGWTAASVISQLAFVSGTPDNNTAAFLVGSDNAATRVIIYSDGDLQNHDNSYGAISGRFFKQDEQVVLSQWEDVKALARLVKKYRMRSDVAAYGEQAPVQLGLIAEDVLPISPGLVRPFMNGLRKDYSLQYSILYMKGFKALGEVMERQERSESRLTRVEQALGIV